eukprot:12757730-Heterocapsa_arctica.AAC.1
MAKSRCSWGPSASGWRLREDRIPRTSTIYCAHVGSGHLRQQLCASVAWPCRNNARAIGSAPNADTRTMSTGRPASEEEGSASAPHPSACMPSATTHQTREPSKSPSRPVREEGRRTEGRSTRSSRSAEARKTSCNRSSPVGTTSQWRERSRLAQ